MKVVRHCGLGIRAIIACFVISLGLTQISAKAWSATQNEIIQACERCHGAGGDSQMGSTPRLNGQQAGYIADRLKTLSSETRTSAHARIGMFQELVGQSDATRLSIAQYFSAKPPTAPKAGARAAEGKEIFEHGLAADNVIACNQCHGAEGQGHDTTPRIAGQHGDYLKAQLQLFNVKFRDHKLMKANTQTMSDNTMQALIAYLAND